MRSDSAAQASPGRGVAASTCRTHIDYDARLAVCHVHMIFIKPR
ncbi:hypothetical protein HNQ59_000330 [Chitinivorax tropicus]|uniref:Uncharacterized protein n=1 Tax=Chitinivorax tropicus TaxID=714531 RepID=A0A840MEF9_9PROT|nr:hypothetical protein [Chitinivorax tropicus]